MADSLFEHTWVPSSDIETPPFAGDSVFNCHTFANNLLLQIFNKRLPLPHLDVVIDTTKPDFKSKLMYVSRNRVVWSSGFLKCFNIFVCSHLSKSFVSTWSSLEDEEIEIVQVKGGITNKRTYTLPHDLPRWCTRHNCTTYTLPQIRSTLLKSRVSRNSFNTFLSYYM
jgi:hypothetical protein